MSEFYNYFEKTLFLKSRCLAGWHESLVLSLAAQRLDIWEPLAVAMVATATCTEFFNLHLIKSRELYSFLPSRLPFLSFSMFVLRCWEQVRWLRTSCVRVGVLDLAEVVTSRPVQLEMSVALDVLYFFKLEGTTRCSSPQISQNIDRL